MIVLIRNGRIDTLFERRGDTFLQFVDVFWSDQESVDGALLTKTGAKGQVITYFYDTLGRLTQVKNAAIILRTLTYDADGNYGTGNAWTELYSYDPVGGVLKQKMTSGRTSYFPASLQAVWT